MTFTFCYRHIAPYHHAQLNKLAETGVEVTVVTQNDFSSVAFDHKLFSNLKYKLLVLSNDDSKWNELCYTLEKSNPNVVFVPGWGHDYALATLAWSNQAGLPCIAISDSQQCDHPRKFLTENIKKRLVKLFTAGFVAGQRSMHYINQLGMPLDKIMIGCDVVDNEYFIQRTDEVRSKANATRDLLGLPSKYFLAVNRLIDVKNTALVIKSFALFCKENSKKEFSLVIVGTGPLQIELQKLAKELEVDDLVIFTGSISYDVIPAYYALATVFVLASKTEPWGLVINEAMCSGLPILVSERCGSSVDLVKQQVNGLTFEADNKQALALCMKKVVLDDVDIASMGKSSREIISDWSLMRYVNNVKKVAEISLLDPQRKFHIIDRMILSLIIKLYTKSGGNK